MHSPRFNTLIRYSRTYSADDFSSLPIECALVCTAPVIAYDRALRTLSINGPDVTLTNLKVCRFSVEELEQA